MSIGMLEIEMACITRELKYCKLQVEYPENLTHKSRFNSQKFVSISFTSRNMIHCVFTFVMDEFT